MTVGINAQTMYKLGDDLIPFIQLIHPELGNALAKNISTRLLETSNTSELLHMVESYQVLRAEVLF